jgi:hypothetical protein
MVLLTFNRMCVDAIDAGPQLRAPGVPLLSHAAPWTAIPCGVVFGHHLRGRGGKRTSRLAGSLNRFKLNGVAEHAAFERAHYLRTVSTFFSLAAPL